MRKTTEVTVLWTDRDVRCVLARNENTYRLRIERGGKLVREQTDVDDAVLLALGERWRRKGDRPVTKDNVRSVDGKVKPKNDGRAPVRRQFRVATPPPCIYCGANDTKDVTPTDASSTDRWYECAFCFRRFAVAT